MARSKPRTHKDETLGPDGKRSQPVAGGETKARVYWHNKATGITTDAPAEAQLPPSLWGIFRFED